MGLKFSNEILWGKLVKSWSTGVNYIDEGGAVIPVPRDLTEMLRQCSDIGVEVTGLSKDQIGIAILQHSPEVIGIKLPPKALVHATEELLRQSKAAYPLPRFYADFFRTRMPDLELKDLLDLHAARIGDYSIQHCG